MSDTIRFYFDEHVGRAIAKGLRRRGIDVLTLTEAGMLGVSDEEHMAFARSHERVIVTHDDDYLRLAAEGVKTMVQDEIMREVRAIREQRAAQRNYDVRALYEEAKQREQQGDRRVVQLQPRRVQEATEGSA